MSCLVDVFYSEALLLKWRREDTPKKDRVTRRSRSLAIVTKKEAASIEIGKPQ